MSVHENRVIEEKKWSCIDICEMRGTSFHHIYVLFLLSRKHLNRGRNNHNQVLSSKIGIWKWNVINICVNSMNSD